MNQKLFENIKKVHLIGIGGIGVSALARMMLLLGKEVTGSDISENMVNKRIKRLGGRVFIGHKASNLSKDTDMVIYSPAIKDDNPELILAKKFNIPIYSYPEALGLISKDMKTIAISGTHGKTTITAMLAEVMILAKKSPTVIIGSFLKKQKDNFILGKSEYFVVEACEYKESFLNLFPSILVIANIDNDHLDYYGSIENIQKAFAKLIVKVPKDGFVVCNPNDKNVKQALKIANKKAEVVDYIKEKLNVELGVPGEHNIKNAQAVLAVARLVGIKKEQARQKSAG
jgi:UDP-N-acetylmuramate--alanine ligase